MTPRLITPNTEGSNTTESGDRPHVEAPIVMVDVADLRLDALNPRRTDRNVEKNQRSLLIELYRSFDLDDLLASLSTYGYFSEEPLIATPESDEQGDTPAYTVVEGNRRLAALKILLYRADRDAVKIRKIPKITQATRQRLNPVPVKIYPTREEVHPYLGVRHIVGVKSWEALAKARYVRSLREHGYALAEVARRVGSGKRTDVVRRWLLALYSLEQANQEADEPWDEVDDGFGFSWLYTSLGYRSVRDYIGVTSDVFDDPRGRPIPKEAIKNLLDHMGDLYGPPPGHPRKAAVRESRQLKDLADVYAHEDALAALRSGVSLEVAFEMTVREETRLVDLLRKANFDLMEANGIAPHYSGHDEAAQFARRCLETATVLVSTLANKK